MQGAFRWFQRVVLGFYRGVSKEVLEGFQSLRLAVGGFE